MFLLKSQFCQNEVGKPPFVATKEAEGDHACISDVIPLLNKLHYEVNSVDSAGIGTLKSSVLSELQRYFDTMYGVESSSLPDLGPEKTQL